METKNQLVALSEKVSVVATKLNKSVMNVLAKKVLLGLKRLILCQMQFMS
jgi:hypothetical protein